MIHTIFTKNKRKLQLLRYIGRTNVVIATIGNGPKISYPICLNSGVYGYCRRAVSTTAADAREFKYFILFKK